MQTWQWVIQYQQLKIFSSVVSDDFVFSYQTREKMKQTKNSQFFRSSRNSTINIKIKTEFLAAWYETVGKWNTRTYFHSVGYNTWSSFLVGTIFADKKLNMLFLVNKILSTYWWKRRKNILWKNISVAHRHIVDEHQTFIYCVNG